MPVRAAHDAPATAWMVGLFAAWVILASAIDVGTGVEGMFEQVLQRHAVGSTPDQLTLPNARSFPDPDTKADVVAREIPQEAAERAKYLKLLEDEPHHLLHLLVWVQLDLPLRPPNIAGWQGKVSSPRRALLKQP